MNSREKCELLKDSIYQLYSKEGRSKQYISKLLDIYYKVLCLTINEWGFEQAKSRRYLTPSNQKFANKNRLYIKSLLDKDVSVVEVAKRLQIKYDYLADTLYNGDDIIKTAIDEYRNRQKKIIETNKAKEREIKRYIDFHSEDWHEIVGYDGYYISKHGEFCKKLKHGYKIILAQKNCRSGYWYCKIGSKGFAVHRLVAIYFVDGRTQEKNTVNHIDGNKDNNDYTNLEWTSQSDNNKHSYAHLNRPINRGKRYKDIILDNKYHFKTITALAKFLNVSWTQADRYISGETQTEHTFQIIV